MGVDEGFLQVQDVDVMLENCPITIALSACLTHYGMLRFYTITTKNSSEV